MKNIYYAYIHRKKINNEIFYVGIGKKPARFITHYQEYRRAYEKSKRNQIWKNIVNKYDYIVEIIYECSEEQEIIDKEIELIKKYGKIIEKTGILCNITDGGKGITSYKHTDETKQIIGEFSKKRIRRKGYKLNLSEKGRENKRIFMKNKIISEETRKKFSKNLINNKRGNGHLVTQEQREKTRKRLFKKIDQYTLDNVFIKTWESMQDIIKFFNHTSYTSLKRNLENESKHYKNFLWKYHKENI